MQRSVSEASQPLMDSSNPQPCGMHLLRGLRNDAVYLGNRRSLGPLQDTGLQVRTALPQTSLKWLIFCLAEGNKSSGAQTPWLPRLWREGASSHISLNLPAT